MRWSFSLSRPKPNVVRRWFAILPVSIGDETRWLEWVAVEFADLPHYAGDGYYDFSYERVRFINE